MSIVISGQMNASLVALTQINDDVTKTQGRLSSGLAIASASDNVAVYFKAKSFGDKAEGLDSTNKNISQAVSNLDVVDKALSNMQDNLKGAVQLMRDARAKAVTVQKAAMTAGDQSYNTVTVGARTLKGDIVQPAALAAGSTATNADSSGHFQVGDVFAITLADSSSSTGGKVTKYFRATDPAAAVPTTAVNAAGAAVIANGNLTTATTPAGTPAAATGATFNQALNFNDLDSLGSAIQSAFGYDNITVNLTPTVSGTTTTYKLGFQLANLTTSLSFAQVNDQPVGTGAGTPTDPGAAFNFNQLFGKLQNAANATYGTAASSTSEALTFLAGTTSTTVNGATVFSATGGAANNADAAIQARLDAANFFRQTLVGLDNLVKDAALPGYANILRGEQMSVNLNEVGDVKQVVQLTQKADPQSLGFLGFTVNGAGVANTGQTNTDFRTDATIDTSITQATTATTLLRQVQTILAAAKTAMNSRLDYNKTLVNVLNTGATEMTAANTTAEAANMASLQNRQAFATNNLSVTKQAEQSLIQLLR